MKQKITQEQWNEVDNEARWFFQNGYSRPENVIFLIKRDVPNIGEMIEFLRQHNRLFVVSDIQTTNAFVASGIKKPNKDNSSILTQITFASAGIETGRELCDNLWEAVKEVLKGSDK